MGKCQSCGSEKITDRVEKYSKEKFNKVLCFDCQKKDKEPQKAEVVEPQQYDPAFFGMISNQTNMQMLGKPLSWSEWEEKFDMLFEFNLKKKKELTKCQ